MAERRGVQIDYCPACRGIWLDHGELEKILEVEMRENSTESMEKQIEHLMPPPDVSRRGAERAERYRGDDHDQYDYRYGKRGRRDRRRGGFWGEIADIFD